MLDSGIKLESVRDAFDFVRAQDPDFSTARLVIADGSATLVSNDAEMIDVVNTFHGLGTFNLNLLMIDGLSGELDEAVSARSAATSPRSPDAADRVAEPHAIPTVDG